MKSIIGGKFKKFLQALENCKNKINSKKDISLQIYFDLFKIREAQWEHKLNFKRRVDYSVSDIFQDLIAYYLKITLPKKFDIILKQKTNKIRPDILIRRNGKNWAAIEVKTTIGWNRDLVKNNNFMKRVYDIQKAFKIPEKRIFYIFESSRNVSKEFSEQFRAGSKKEKINKHILKHILPLFDNTADPFYISKKLKIKDYKQYSNKEIIELYYQNRITNFNQIIKKIEWTS